MNENFQADFVSYLELVHPISTSPTAANLLIQNATPDEGLSLRHKVTGRWLSGISRLKKIPVKFCQHTYNLLLVNR